MEATPRQRIVLDAYPVVALLRGEPCAAEVATLLRENRGAMSAVTVAEVADVLVRVFSRDPERVAAVLESLLEELIEVEAPTVAVATDAGVMRARWYKRRAREASLGDCFVAATARPADAVATADPVLAEIARGEGLEVIALPDSTGRRP